MLNSSLFIQLFDHYLVMAPVNWSAVIHLPLRFIQYLKPNQSIAQYLPSLQSDQHMKSYHFQDQLLSF